MSRRVIAGLTRSIGPTRIADAWMENELLVLLSPEFERLVVPLEKLTDLLGSHPRRVREFELDADGSFVYWPHADVYLGWQQAQQLVDPAATLSARARSADFKLKYGAAIRSVREQAQLRQADIKGVTERNLRRVEKGELRASSATLMSLATAHQRPLNDYLAELAGLLESSRPSTASVPFKTTRQ